MKQTSVSKKDIAKEAHLINKKPEYKNGMILKMSAKFYASKPKIYNHLKNFKVNPKAGFQRNGLTD